MAVRLSQHASGTRPEETTITARTALVGGGATGIGYAIAERLAPTHRVVITGRRAGPLEKAATRIKADGRCRRHARQRHRGPGRGGGRSGRDDGQVRPTRRADPQRRRPAARPHPGRHRRRLAGRRRTAAARPAAAGQAALPGMASRGFGRLVFVTSTAVRQPQPDLAISVVLRAAVTAAAKLLSREYAADGVTVNCVAPGATDTQRRRDILSARAARDRTAAGRAGRPGHRPGPGRPRRRTRPRSRPRSRSSSRPRQATSTGPCSRSMADGRRRSDGTLWRRIQHGRLPRRDQRLGPPGHRAAARGARRTSWRHSRPGRSTTRPRWPLPGGCRPPRSSCSGRRSRPARARTCNGTTTRRCTTSSPATGTATSRTTRRTWAAGDFIYTPPWTWHRHYNDSAGEPVEFLTIENSRLLQALGIARRQSAGLCTVAEARARFPEDQS